MAVGVIVEVSEGVDVMVRVAVIVGVDVSVGDVVAVLVVVAIGGSDVFVDGTTFITAVGD